MSVFDLTPKAWTGRLVDGEGGGDRLYATDFEAWARSKWPDLAPDEWVAVLPKDDFEALVEGLQGSPALPIRRIWTVRVRPASSPEKPGSLAGKLSRLLDNPAFAYLLGVIVATLVLWNR